MSRNPDIQRLLANLRGSIISNDQNQQPQASANSNVATGSSDTSQPLQGSNYHLQNEKGSLGSHKEESSATARAFSQDRSSTPNTPDASNITTWPSAIKFISKHIAPHEKLETKIKQLIANQHKHEQDWWKQRQLITNRHTGRVGNQQKAAELLRSLGGQAVPVAPSDPKADLAELEAFDQKVYRSLVQLATHYDRELRQMGLPFFAIRHDLVIPDRGDAGGDASKGRLDRGELRALQHRLLVYLEELFGDEPLSI